MKAIQLQCANYEKLNEAFVEHNVDGILLFVVA